MGLLNDAATWWLGHIDDALIDEEIVNPINALGLDNDGFTPFTGYASGYDAYKNISGGFGFPPGYLLYSSGKVELRGIIGKTSGNFPTGSGTTIFAALPAAIQPAQQVQEAAACTLSTVAMARVGINGAALNISIPAGASVNWVSLDGVNYWIA